MWIVVDVRQGDEGRFAVLTAFLRTIYATTFVQGVHLGAERAGHEEARRVSLGEGEG